MWLWPTNTELLYAFDYAFAAGLRPPEQNWACAALHTAGSGFNVSVYFFYPLVVLCIAFWKPTVKLIRHTVEPPFMYILKRIQQNAWWQITHTKIKQKWILTQKKLTRPKKDHAATLLDGMKIV